MPTPGPEFATRRRVATLLIALLPATPAFALLRFNDSRDQVYVTAYVGVGYDSNIFANSRSDNGDMVITGGAGVEYARKAGLIGVNASLSWDFGRYGTFIDEDYLNPTMSLEFSKGTGRTKGSLQINAKEESRADPTVGLRTDSWTYGVNLNYRYPIIERYSIAGGVGWTRTDYLDDTNTFSDLDLYSFNSDLFYQWRSDRDLLAGYRYQFSDSAATSQSTDHSVYVGVAGRIVSKLSGTAKVGWTYRTTEYPAQTVINGTGSNLREENSDGLYLLVSSTWPATRKATFTLTLNQDFDITSTNYQTRTTTADLTGQFSHTVKLSTRVNVGGGYTDYISGFANNSPTYTPGFNNQDREDYYLTFGLSASYSITPHISISPYYTYYRNWSSLSSFEFTRHSVGLTVSTRW